MRKIVVLILLLLTGCLAGKGQEKTSVAILDEKETKPVSIGIVVDNSYSFRPALDFVINTAKAISNDVQTKDEAFLVRFVSADRIEILQDLTSNSNLLVSAADDMFCEGGATAIPGALVFSAKHLLEKGKNERKILILISDGEDRVNKKVPLQTLNFLKENKIAVFSVGITMLLESNVADAKNFLEKLASETGGAVVFVDKKTSAAEAANAIVKAFRAQ